MMGWGIFAALRANVLTMEVVTQMEVARALINVIQEPGLIIAIMEFGIAMKQVLIAEELTAVHVLLLARTTMSGGGRGQVRLKVFLHKN